MRCIVIVVSYGVDEIRDINVGSCFLVGDRVGCELIGGIEYLVKDYRDNYVNIDIEEKFLIWSLGR